MIKTPKSTQIKSPDSHSLSVSIQYIKKQGRAFIYPINGIQAQLLENRGVRARGARVEDVWKAGKLSGTRGEAFILYHVIYLPIKEGEQEQSEKEAVLAVVVELNRTKDLCFKTFDVLLEPLDYPFN